MKVSEGAKKVVLVVVSHFISESLVGEVLEEVRGYHYYAGSAWSNQIIKGFRGATGSVSTK